MSRKAKKEEQPTQEQIEELEYQWALREEAKEGGNPYVEPAGYYPTEYLPLHLVDFLPEEASS